jgi:two-component system nitrogen regulation sensor histidine kinase NtrY
MGKRRFKLSYDQGIVLYMLLGGFPAVVAALVLLWTGAFEDRERWTGGFLIVFCWLVFAAVVHSRVIRPLQTMANLLSALREGDFSVRARGANRIEALGDVLAEINTLSLTLQQQRLSALEATALLRTVMAEIEVAIFAFDGAGVLRLANPAAERLLGRNPERMLGREAGELGLDACLTGDPTRLLPLSFAGTPGGAEGSARWGMRRSAFRQGGREHQLVVIADLAQPLRQEELRAWQSLVRVLGHELNNSLAPIKSIAGSLGTLLRRDPRPADWEVDMRSGLEIIESRAEGLSRFLSAYASLAKLPAPLRAPCSVGDLVRRSARLETSDAVRVVAGEAVALACDAAQIEQVLINLIKNALEASLETAAAGRPAPVVTVTWRTAPGSVEIVVEDNGPGIANPANLFVPFFTTKPAGTGIGLVLCRQIAENHGGSLTLRNRAGSVGSIATLILPT